MKKLLLILLLTSGCSGWQINGIDLHNATKKDYAKMVGGAALSPLVHYLGHVAYLEMNNIEWYQDGFSEIFNEPLTDGKKEAFGRSGFLSQLFVGFILNKTIPDSYFTHAYDAATFLEISLYPAINKNESDLKCIGETNRIEWISYSMLSTYLVMEKKEKYIIDYKELIKNDNNARSITRF